MKNKQEHEYLSYANRPEMIKDEIDSAYRKISENESSKWRLYNGNSQYGLFVASEAYLLQNLINNNKEQKEFYILEVGAGNFQFARYMAKFINQQVSAGELTKDITVNIISTRGEKNSQEPYSKNGNCKLWEYGNFKIENLIEEFNNFNSKFDLIVSNYTLRHLVDPLGTFLQMHDLLKEDGIMITDTFSFQVKNTDITPEFYLPSGVLISYLHDIGDEVLVGKGRDSRSYPAIAVRKHGKDIKIPLNYNNYTYDNDANAYYQIFTSNTSLKIDAIDFVLQALDTSEGKRNIVGNKSLFKLFADALLLEIHENLAGRFKSRVIRLEL